MIKLLTAVCARQRSPVAQRFLGGAAWSAIATIASSGFSLVAMMLVARLLGKEAYGQLVAIQSTLGIASVVAGFGIGIAAIHHVAELRLREPKRLAHILAITEGAVLMFALISAISLMLLSKFIASETFNSPSLAPPLSISALSVLFLTLDGYQKSVLIGLEAMRAFAIGTLLGSAFSVPIMFVGAAEYGLNGVAGAMVINGMIQAGISRFQMAKEMRRSGVSKELSGCMNEWRVLRDFALPSLLSGLLVTPAHWACYAMLANSKNGYAELAVLGVAMQWFNVILFFPNVASKIVLPMLTGHLVDEKHADTRRLLLLAISANAIACIPLAILIAAFSAWILQFYGTDFQHGSISMIIAVLTASLLAVELPVGNMVVASARVWLGALMNLGWASIYVGLSYIFVNHGSAGILGAMGIAYLAHAVWVFAFASSKIGKKPKELEMSA